MTEPVRDQDEAAKKVPVDDEKVRPVEMGIHMLRTVRGVRGKLRALGTLLLNVLP
jgi:hypothetical protein